MVQRQVIVRDAGHQLLDTLAVGDIPLPFDVTPNGTVLAFKDDGTWHWDFYTSGDTWSLLAYEKANSDHSFSMQVASDTVEIYARDAAGDFTARVYLNASGIRFTGKEGHFGQTPTAQPATPTTLNEVIAALQVLGLVG